jgi:hypothetical protein
MCDYFDESSRRWVGEYEDVMKECEVMWDKKAGEKLFPFADGIFSFFLL